MKQSFRDLQAWQRAMELAELVYRQTAAFPKHETYGLSSQMRRAAVSVPSNIAEGSARASRKEVRYFLHVARGSNAELQTQLLLATCLGYISAPDFIPTEDIATRVAQLLNGLLRSLKPPQP